MKITNLMVYDALYVTGKFKYFCEEFLNINLQAILNFFTKDKEVVDSPETSVNFGTRHVAPDLRNTGVLSIINYIKSTYFNYSSVFELPK